MAVHFDVDTFNQAYVSVAVAEVREKLNMLGKCALQLRDKVGPADWADIEGLSRRIDAMFAEFERVGLSTKPLL